MSSHGIGITLGDPCGIGPEIVAATLADAPHDVAERLFVFADGAILDRALRQLGVSLPSSITVVDRAELDPNDAPLGQPTAACGRAQVAYLEAAVERARSGDIGALVTAPISKTAATAAGFEFPGHTEFLGARLGAETVAMMFAGPRLKVVLATVHVPLRGVPDALDVDGLVARTRLAAEAMRRDFGVERPRVGVVGLNPHAGEGGMFGREEDEIIAPAVARCRAELDWAELAGPLVPDAAFREAVDGRYDVVIAMYHDQGLIPVKVLDFDESVNVTLGLPIVRTSPDHGVAYDIAGTGTARHASFAAALRTAVELGDRRASRTSSK